MGVKGRRVQRDHSSRLNIQIESLQDAFRELAGASSLKDLAGRFSAVAGKEFPSSGITVLFRHDGEEQWKVLDAGEGGGRRGPSDLPASMGTGDAHCTIREDDSCLCAVQKLVDGAMVGIAVEQGSRELSAGDAIALRILGHLFDTAYQALLSRRNEKDLIFSLNHRVLQLNSLIDTGIEVSKLDQGSLPHQLALQRAASLTNASRGIVRVTENGNQSAVFTFPEGTSVDTPAEDGRRITTGFTFLGGTYSFELFDKESRTGSVPFDETDQLLLDALARQVHASLENRYLLRQALDKQRLEQDLAVAASIQQRILPTALPKIHGYDIAGANIMSRSVGGDYYDCIPLPGGTFALVVADVAGKGMPAALLVSTLHAYLQAYMESGLSLVELAVRLNRAIYSATTDDKFITAFFAVLSPETGEVESVNAGHNPAYWLRKDGSVVELSAGGVALGMLEMDFPYQSEKTLLEKGERLLLYTDGIPEAANSSRQMYENTVPLQQFFAGHTPGSARGFLEELMEDIRRFTGDAPQSDDITALYLLREQQGPGSP